MKHFPSWKEEIGETEQADLYMWPYGRAAKLVYHASGTVES
jgi:hypothetical protein